MHLGVTQEDYRRERGPDGRVACQEGRLDCTWVPLLPTGMHQHIQHGHTRRQHHGDRHHLPASQEYDQGHEQGEMAPLDQVVMINQVALVGNGRQQGDGPGGNHQESGPEHRCPAARNRASRPLVIQVGCFHGTHRAPPSWLHMMCLGTPGPYASKWKLP